MPVPYSAVVYDLDGTLVDSAPVVAAILNGMRVERGDAALPQRYFYDWISLGGKELVGNALGLAGAQADAALTVFRARYAELPTPPDTVYPQVRASLAALQAQGMLLGICSNKPRLLVDKVLAETGLGAYFSAVVAGDDLPTKKPDPANLHACLQRLQAVPGTALYVGDSTVDQACARNAGVDFAFFTPGYDDGVQPAAAALQFDDHAQLCAHLGTKLSAQMPPGQPRSETP